MSRTRKQVPGDSLAALLTSFFQEYLQRIRGASPHTVRAYRDAIRMFLVFLAEAHGRAVDELRLPDFDVEHVLAFLNHLEADRGNTARTRNCRLAALRSFFSHLVRNDPANAEQYSRVLALPAKRSQKRPAVYLEPEDVRAILRMPDRRTPLGLRDHALLMFMYNTGARVSETLALRGEDLELTRPRRVRLHGKGNKIRFCPLWRDTATALRRLIRQRPPAAGGAIFNNALGSPLTRDGVAYILEKHARKASAERPALRKCHATPHVLRHSCAVALLQAGVDLTVIRDYLGHAEIGTTNRYVSTNLGMRREALEAFYRRAGLTPTRDSAWSPTPDLLRFLAGL